MFSHLFFLFFLQLKSPSMPDTPPPTDNPFHSRDALLYSAYQRPEVQEEALSETKQPIAPKKKPLQQLQHFIQSESYPCLAAKAAFNTASYRTGIYPALAHEQVTEGLCYDLIQFVREKPHIKKPFTSFLALFESPFPAGEKEFEKLLWKQLSLLDARSRQFYAWNKEVSANPEAEDFSFSFGGQAFFVVGMHPKASRLARRFSYPLLVFNPHEQFEELKEQGLYTGMKKQIRKRDLALQGSPNPMLEDFGTASEARQYAGRKLEPDWKCPFNPKEK